ncbi:hypothetical protein ACH4CC_17400 [Streptomyces lydicus]|uniref:hypothetical protein n=1 Tax=Streptomyces lydicus TaxID=47763 RepID=UPI0037B66C41
MPQPLPPWRTCTRLARPPGVLLLRYEPGEFGGLPLQRVLDAVHAEGATMADQPGSTCPLNTHPAVRAPQGSAAWLR